MPIHKTRNNSEIEAWLRCPRMHDYAYNAKLRPVVDRMPLMAGTAAHRCAREVYRGRPFLPKLEGWYHEMVAHLRMAEDAEVSLGWDNAKLDEEYQGLAAGMGAYEHLYQAEGWTITDPELKLDLRIPGTSTSMRGAIDGIIWINEVPWIHELKTTRKKWDGSDTAMHRQMANYIWGARAQHNSAIVGVVLRVIRLRTPEVKILQSGKPSKAKSQQVVPREYLERSIQETGADPAEYAELLAELPGIAEFFLQTDTVIYTPEAISQYLEEDLVPVVKVMDRAVAKNYRPRSSGLFGLNCQNCTYARLCKAEFDGDPAADDIRAEFIVEPDKHIHLVGDDD